jgi:hypothetical protein
VSSGTADRLARGAVAAALFACTLAVAGCGWPSPEPPPADPAARPANWSTVASDELLAPARGVVVTDRSGELSYVASSLNAVDGDDGTIWISPPKDTVQWLVVELPALTKIRQVGASTGDPGSITGPVKTLRFEGSVDGITFTGLQTVDLATKQGPQLFDVTPTEVRFLKVTTLANHKDNEVTLVPSLHARGEELEPVPPPSFSGRWNVNGHELDLSQDGNVVYGVVRMEPPMIFYGTVAGRGARLAWSRGNENGIARLDVDPSSTHLSGLWWWIDPLLNFNLGEAWISQRVGDAPRFTVPIPKIADVHIRKVGRFPLYGLVFRPDGDLDLEASASGLGFIRQALASFPTYKVRLEVVACDSWIEAKNLEAARARASRLAAGLERSGLPKERIVVEGRSRTDLVRPIYRLMYDQVEFSLAGN